MSRVTYSHWAGLVLFNVLALGMLGLYTPSGAAPPRENEPFANSVEQRFEIIRQLKELNAQMKEQNALLRSGTLRVVVEVPPKAPVVPTLPR